MTNHTLFNPADHALRPIKSNRYNHKNQGGRLTKDIRIIKSKRRAAQKNKS